MPRDFPFPGAKIVFIDNPEDVHNLLSEIFGEDFPIGKNPTESKADFPIGKDDPCSECPVKGCADRTAAYEGADDEPCPIGLDDPVAQDCTSCDVKDCKVRVVPFGATVPVKTSSKKEMSRALKDNALRDALRTEKLKLDIIEREAQLARQAMVPRSPHLWPAPSAEEFAKGVEALRKAIGAASPKVPKDHISTPKFKVSFPFMEKPAEPKGEKHKVNLDLGKAFEPLKERIEATLADIRKAEKKRKDAELDDLAARLYKSMSHQFYRDRAFRLSRIDELLGQVDKLTDELRNKEKVIDFYKKAVDNPESVDWNKTADKKTGHFVYLAADEFDTFKALKAGTAKVSLASKPVEPMWFDFVDKEVGKFVFPERYATVEISDPNVNGGRVQTLVRVDEHSGVRFQHRPSGTTIFFTSPNGVVTPFGFESAKWRYKPVRQPPVPDDIPLGDMV